MGLSYSDRFPICWLIPPQSQLVALTKATHGFQRTSAIRYTARLIAASGA